MQEWLNCYDIAPEMINDKISADIMIQYTVDEEVYTSRGRCFKSQTKDGYAHYYYVYEYLGIADNWQGLGDRANSWYSLGGETTVSPPFDFSYDCKLSHPHVNSDGHSVDILVKWYNGEDYQVNIGYYEIYDEEENEGSFYIYTYQIHEKHSDYIMNLDGAEIAWLPLPL